MPRRKKNKGSSEDPDLEPRQPWETDDTAAAAQGWPEPKPKPVPVASEPQAVVVAAAAATPRATPRAASSQVAGGHYTYSSTSSIRRQQPSSDEDIEELGRLLTRILRHQATELRLAIRGDGFVEVAALLRLSVKTRGGRTLSSFSVDDVRLAAARDRKRRMGLVEDGGRLYIRANQGHSMTAVVSEQLLKPVLNAREVPVCVHGTQRMYLDSIFAKGLSKMQRLHVHFATGLPNDSGVISGMRSSSNVLIHLNVEKALADGMKLFKSDNGVILTEGFNGVVPAKYFKRVESLPGRKEIRIPTAGVR